MKTIDPDLLMSALAEALETMAFVTINPEFDLTGCVTLLRVSLAFSGVIAGQLTLCAPRALGSVIAANLTAVDVESVTPENAADALRELANITAGLLLRQVCSPEEMPQLAIPIVSSTPAAVGPHSYCLAALSAEGHPVTIAFRTHA